MIICLISLLVADTAAAQTTSARRRTAPRAMSAARVDADAGRVRSAPARSGDVRSVNNSRSRVVFRPKQTQTQAVRSTNDHQTIQQVGYLDGPSGCGPVCDCDSCSTGPVCGTEGVFLEGPGCGLETLVLDGGCGCDSCTGSIGSCDGYVCDSACEVDCFPLFLPILRVDWNRFAFFFGTQAFKNPMNSPSIAANQRTNSGSFGFHQGFNEGRNLKPWTGVDLAAQLGLRATQSNSYGDAFTNETRNQIFLTGGFFRRVDFGLQYGIVLDYLSEDWYYQTDLLQLRGEVSWKTSACEAFGFHWMAGVNEETVTTQATNAAGAVFPSQETIEPSNQYRAFYRRRFGSMGHWTSFIGGTGDEHFIVGSEAEIPLMTCWSMQMGSTYFAPSDDVVFPKSESEGWNIGLSVVFRPGMKHPANRYRRPMFNVADNGTFFVFR